MHYKDIRMNNLMRDYIDGIPLDLASNLLPKFVRLGIFTNIHLHAWFQTKYNHSLQSGKNNTQMSLKKHILLIRKD